MCIKANCRTAQQFLDPRWASRPGICCTVAASGGLCEGEKFQEIVGGADHGPLGTYFLDAAQQKLAEAACLFDLSEHRLHHLLSQSVTSCAVRGKWYALAEARGRVVYPLHLTPPLRCCPAPTGRIGDGVGYGPKKAFG